MKDAKQRRRVPAMLIGGLLTLGSVAPIAAQDKADSAQIDRAVRAACDREVVLLGEDPSHGGGRTLAVKVVLVERLLTECGFGAVLFESQFYDFLDFERDLAAGRATRKGLADAIGALWANAVEFQPLIDLLYQRAATKKTLTGGIDPQVGGITGYYSQRRLGEDLASVLETTRAAECAAEFNRHHLWTYDALHPFDDGAKDRLRACIVDIRATLTRLGGRAPKDHDAVAASYARYLAMALDGDANARDLGMFENLRFQRARRPRGEKVIVWTATTHGAKARWPGAPWQPLGALVHEASPGRAFTIGFSALGGSVGRPGGRGPATILGPVEPGSFEAKVMGGFARDLRYVAHDELKTLGRVPGRALGYAKPLTLDWSEIFDGVIVLREEAATERVP
jgi:erythromycin esterase-like protein